MLFPEKLITLRKEKRMTQEELAFQIGVSRQSVSKWETGEAEPNVATLKALSTVLQVSIDYLLSDDDLPPVSAPSTRKVTIEEATVLLAFARKNSFWIAFAALLCILSPVCIILLGGLSEYPAYEITEGMAGGIGMIALLIMVAVAVAIFIIRDGKGAPFSHFEIEPFETEHGVKILVEKAKADYKPTYIRNNVIGVCLCILSVSPLFIGVMLDENNDLLLVCLLSLLFPIAGAGVFFLIRSGVIWASFEKLLQCGDYSKVNKESAAARSTLSLIYWLIVTTIFLGISFISKKWNYTGVIWVLAGVLYPALLTLFDYLRKKK